MEIGIWDEPLVSGKTEKQVGDKRRQTNLMHVFKQHEGGTQLIP